MSKFIFSQRSLDNLKGVHPVLVGIVERALELTSTDFAVICGLRTTEEQKKLMAAGRSKTMNSRHLTGHAVDLMPVKGSKSSFQASLPYFNAIAFAMKESAKESGIPIEWGGDWKEFKDLYHYELPWSAYPLR